jgi:hypothetical protein
MQQGPNRALRAGIAAANTRHQRAALLCRQTIDQGKIADQGFAREYSCHAPRKYKNALRTSFPNFSRI